MSYRNAGDLPPGARIGPLTPYQRPLALLLYVLLPLAVSILIGWFVVESEWLRQWLNGRKVSPTEVKHETIDVATTGNELLLQFDSALQKFDRRSRELFRSDHNWNVDTQNAPIPEYVLTFVEDHGDLRFLKKYSELADARYQLQQTLYVLEARIDEAVSGIPDDASREQVFRAKRLLNREISVAISQLKIEEQNLEHLGTIFKNEENSK